MFDFLLKLNLIKYSIYEGIAISSFDMGEQSTQPPPDPGPQRQVPAIDVPVLKAEELFRGRREVCIVYGGVYYRLRITRRNRLILQK